VSALVPQLAALLRGIWQGRWVGLAVAWLTAVAGSAYIFTTPDRYEATARVYVDTQSILKPLMAGLTVQPNVEQEVAVLSRTLISRPNLEKLVRMTDMDLKVRSNEQRDRLIEGLTQKLSIKSLGRDNLYTIGYADTQPARASRVVQSLLSIFVESGLRVNTQGTGQARRFIEEQIKTYEQRLTEAENRVKEFKLRNLDLPAQAGSDFFGNLGALTENMRQARLQLQEAIRSRDALRQQLADEEERPPSLLPQADDTGALSPPLLEARLGTLNKNLDDLLLRYTENHPDVVNTRRIIKEVESQRDAERRRLVEEARNRGPGTWARNVGNPAYPQLKMALAAAEAQVAGLRARVSDFESRHAEARERARSVPEREAEFAQLNRDYAIHKQNYDNLVARRERALISGDMEATTGVADFRIIDPPSVSPNPVAPNRAMLVPLALLASLGAGLAAAYLFSIVRPTFHDNRSLKTVGQRPVLGAVSLIRSNVVLAKRRRRALLFVGGLGGLAATYSAAIAAVFIKGILPF
jgi:polysaccharide chain length determinant protein (PEP-CTERM system associated)